MDVTTRSIIDTFLIGNPRLATANGSFNKCTSAAMRLQPVLAEAGIGARILHMSHYHGPFAPAHPKWKALGSPMYWAHYAVVVDGMVVDCTARQFDPAAPHPSITPLDDVLDLWEDVEIVEPDGSLTPVRKMTMPMIHG